VTTLNMFWWYNMYSSAEYSVTPRPMYKADGRKVPDCYSEPPELRDELQEAMGRFPLFRFWGPASSIESSRWIASATMRMHQKLDPTLTLVYLPHLDYALQQHGPDAPEARHAATEVDELVGMLLAFFEERGVRPMIVSEYGIEAVDRPVHVNRVLRGAGFVRVREEDGLELLDAGASRAFAVADHQVAHVYVRDVGDRDAVRELCEGIEGVGRVLGRDEQVRAGVQHERTGDFVLEAEAGAWFTYYYWLDDARAPDFARTVDIHRKPGYDPAELFIDPAIRSPKAALAWRLAKKTLGFRTLMDIIPLDATLVKGSHGRAGLTGKDGPVLVTRGVVSEGDMMSCEQVRDVILSHLFDGGE
jgi:predicted AlkP superfamily pyrophosphatase or phosphodiesterase